MQYLNEMHHLINIYLFNIANQRKMYKNKTVFIPNFNFLLALTRLIDICHAEPFVKLHNQGSISSTFYVQLLRS